MEGLNETWQSIFLALIERDGRRAQLMGALEKQNGLLRAKLRCVLSYAEHKGCSCDCCREWKAGLSDGEQEGGG